MCAGSAQVMTIKEKVEQRRREAMEKKQPAPDKKGGGGDGGGLSSKFVLDCLQANEYGDGLLYAELLEGRYLFNKSTGRWLRWAGHHWELDIMEDALDHVEDVAQAYLQEAAAIVGKIDWASRQKDKEQMRYLENVQKQLYRRVLKLRCERGRQNCLKFASGNNRNALKIAGDFIDQQPWLLPCTNGVIDLKTGELRDGRAEDYCLKASPIEWQGIGTPAPIWEQALDDIFSGDRELAGYIQRLFGYALTGLTVEPVLPILYGQGRNGKTTIVETIGHILGPLAGPIQSEMLLDQGRFRSSSGPTPDIVDLRGLRIAFASEVEENRRFSASRVKWLSGSDTLVGRAPHDRDATRFSPSHTLVLLTNHKPDAPMDDFAFWERVHLIPFDMAFVDRPPKAEHERQADKYLGAKLRDEAAGILTWLVQGCIDWQQQGLHPPDKVREATEEYRRDEDILADFIEQCCHVDPEARTQASDLYDSFKEWWQENVSKKALSQKKFGRLMGRRFRRVKSGTYQYIGLRLLGGLGV